MKNEMNLKKFEDKARNEIFWEGYCCDIGIEEYNFAVSFRDVQKEAFKLGAEYVEVLNKVYKEKIGR